MTTYAYNAHRQLQNETRTFNGMTGKSFTLGYSYNLADQVKSVNNQIIAANQPGAPYTENASGLGNRLRVISGVVTNQQGQPVGGVTMTLSGGQSNSTTTDGNGQYSFGALANGQNYTITPSLSGYVFDPSSRTYQSLGKNIDKADFTALPATTTTFNKTINYARNNTGTISGIGTNLIGSDPNATANVTSAMTYRAWNAYHGMNFGNGLRLTVGHNSQRLQMTSFVVDQQNGSSYLWRQYYDYYNGGANNSKIRRISDDPNFAVHKLYQYDAYNRLKLVLNSNSPDWHAGYSYDEWGNIQTINSVASGGATLTYQTNATGAPTNRLATAGGYSFSYDNAGNMTAGNGQTYGYDAANRLKATGGASNQYGYDGDGKRVRQPGLFYVQSTVLDKVAMEVDANANVQRAYVYLGGEVIALQSTDGNFYWAHTDQLSSGRMLTSTSGSMVYRADFDPFGQMTYEWSASGNNNLNTRKFTGYERDATGLDHAQARTYTSSWGRFTQSDPLGSGFGGGKPNPNGAAKTGLPQTLNRYSYVSNDPINKTDPSGLLIRNPDDGCVCCGGGGDDQGGAETRCECDRREKKNCEKPYDECSEKAFKTFEDGVAECHKKWPRKPDEDEETTLARGYCVRDAERQWIGTIQKECEPIWNNCIKNIPDKCRDKKGASCLTPWRDPR